MKENTLKRLSDLWNKAEQICGNGFNALLTWMLLCKSENLDDTEEYKAILKCLDEEWERWQSGSSQTC